jgi:hypothetical protein
MLTEAAKLPRGSGKGCIQSRQSAKPFLQSSELGPPPPPQPQDSVPPYPLVREGGHTRLRERGWGSLNSDEVTYTVVLNIHTYFVGAQLLALRLRATVNASCGRVARLDL